MEQEMAAAEGAEGAEGVEGAAEGGVVAAAPASFEMRSMWRFEPGEEVFISYGHETGAELLTSYGFFPVGLALFTLFCSQNINNLRQPVCSM